MADLNAESPCKNCRHWVQQRNNKLMGHCQAPLPASIREVVGRGIMERGMWMWIDSVKTCEAVSRKLDVTRVGRRQDVPDGVGSPQNEKAPG